MKKFLKKLLKLFPLSFALFAFFVFPVFAYSTGGTVNIVGVFVPRSSDTINGVCSFDSSGAGHCSGFTGGYSLYNDSFTLSGDPGSYIFVLSSNGYPHIMGDSLISFSSPPPPVQTSIYDGIFSGVIAQVTSLLAIVFPSAILLFALIFGLKFIKYIFKTFSSDDFQQEDVEDDFQQKMFNPDHIAEFNAREDKFANWDNMSDDEKGEALAFATGDELRAWQDKNIADYESGAQIKPPF